MSKSESNRVRAEIALAAMKEAILAEVIAAGDDGIRNDQIARALGLETSVNGGQRNHLTHALLNGLVQSGHLKRQKIETRIYYRNSLANPTIDQDRVSDIRR